MSPHAGIAAALTLAVACGSPPATPAPASPGPASPAPAAADAARGAEPAWSATVDGLRARLVVSVPDKPEAEHGVRMARTWIEIENVSDVANPVDLFWNVDKIFDFALEDADGKPAATGSMAASIAMVPPFWLVIPSDSLLRVSITTWGYGVLPNQGDVFLGLPATHAWQLAHDDTRVYRLRGRLAVPSGDGDDRYDADRQVWQNAIDLPPVAVSR